MTYHVQNAFSLRTAAAMGGGSVDGLRSSSGAALSKYGADILHRTTAVTARDNHNMSISMRFELVLDRHTRQKDANLCTVLVPTATFQSVLIVLGFTKTMQDCSVCSIQTSQTCLVHCGLPTRHAHVRTALAARIKQPPRMRLRGIKCSPLALT